MSHAVRINSTSTVYLKQAIEAVLSGEPYNPTSYAVHLQLQSLGSDPDDAGWIVGSWETDGTVSPSIYYARLLVGPFGDVTVADGTYRLWVKITHSPEVPVLEGGIVHIT